RAPARPVALFAAGREYHAGVPALAVDRYPPFAQCGDGQGVGCVGVQFHGAWAPREARGTVVKLPVCSCAAGPDNILARAGRAPVAGGTLKTIQKSAKLANVCYDIRGPIMDA